MKPILIFLFSAILFYSCSGDNPVTGNNNTADTYVKIITAENNNTRFEMWSATGDSLMTGYNKIGFKVFENDQPKTSGFVKFFAKMYHLGATDMHATPVQPAYYYDDGLQMFTGYIVMLMPSDSTSMWYGYYNYNDLLNIDSAQFDVGWETRTKFKIFVDLNASLSYLITVLSPLDPARGLNDFRCMLHESPNFINFTQVTSAQMYTRVYLDSLNHTSAGNINPIANPEGIYEGRLNFDYPGLWRVYDSVYYNNKWITENGTPYIVFQVP